MSNPSATPSAGASREPRAAHLTVRPEGLGPREVPFLFQQQEKRIGNALGVSVATHVIVLAVALFIVRMVPAKVYDAAVPGQVAKTSSGWPTPDPVAAAVAAATTAPNRPRRSSCLASRR